MRKASEYALYKGEEIIDMGTIAEIAERQGVQKATIRFYGKPAYQKRKVKKPTGKRKILIKIEKGDDIEK